VFYKQIKQQVSQSVATPCTQYLLLSSMLHVLASIHWAIVRHKHQKC